MTQIIFGWRVLRSVNTRPHSMSDANAIALNFNLMMIVGQHFECARYNAYRESAQNSLAIRLARMWNCVHTGPYSIITRILKSECDIHTMPQLCKCRRQNCYSKISITTTTTKSKRNVNWTTSFQFHFVAFINLKICHFSGFSFFSIFLSPASIDSRRVSWACGVVSWKFKCSTFMWIREIDTEINLSVCLSQCLVACVCVGIT